MDLINDEFLVFLKCTQQHDLRYMIIGDYAVNFHGYSSNTDDLDVWVAPTNENKLKFIDTLLCMNYTESEVSTLHKENFTLPFVGTFGSLGNDIDILTVVHHSISFDLAEKNKDTFEILPGILLNFVSYETLKEIKLLARRDKDLFDISQLEIIRNNN